MARYCDIFSVNSAIFDYLSLIEGIIIFLLIRRIINIIKQWIKKCSSSHPSNRQSNRSKFPVFRIMLIGKSKRSKPIVKSFGKRYRSMPSARRRR
jgi:hypothetical protein